MLTTSILDEAATEVLGQSGVADFINDGEVLAMFGTIHTNT